MGVSRCFSVRQPPEGPPVCTALNFLPPLMPPPISYIISRNVIPIGTSMRPTLLILPASANTLVPFDFSVPMDENQSAPLRIMAGILANVSTLFTLVGLSRYPFTEGNGGLLAGSPRLPSMEWISAVSSPQTNAPAP